MMSRRTINLIVSITILLMIIFACSYEKESKSNLDFSSIEPFWELVALLEQEIEPSEQDWDRLFSTPGYKTFLSREMKPKWMKKFLSLGIRPGQEGKLKEWEDSGFWYIRFPYHFKDVVEKRGEINTFIQEISGTGFQENALGLTLEYYPENTSFDSLPPVSFIFFDKDARGYDPILLDALYAMQKYNKGELLLLLAHETHHYYRNTMLSFQYPHVDSTDHDIVWTFDQIHMEGIADQIDKDSMFSKPWNTKRTEKYQSLLAETPAQIMILDSLLVAYEARNGDLKNIAGEIHKSAPMSGHPMGYYMAKKILEHQSKESLVEDIGNPFAFLRRYQFAALADDDAPSFSPDALKMIDLLEAKY